MATLTTPGLALPYPDGAERVMDGDNAIGALALAVDTPLNALWKKRGARATGASTAVAAAGRIPLSTLVSGTAATIVNNGLTVAAGASGLYLFVVSVTVSTLPVSSAARVTLRRGASILCGMNCIAASGTTTRTVFPWLYPVLAGEDWNVIAEDAMTAALDLQMVMLASAMA